MSALPSPIAVMGLGRTGQSAIRFLQRMGIECIGFDERKQSKPKEWGIEVHFGKWSGKRLSRIPVLLVSPGIPMRHPAIREAAASGCRIISDLDLFVRYYSGDIVAITGTNGKSTTTHLIGTLLEVLPGGVGVGGNIGRPMLDILLEEPVPPRAVLELSSFQLERSQPFAPRWAVLLNIASDHVDMHEHPLAYEQAKLRLFERQGEGDVAMLPYQPRFDGLADQLQRRGVHVRRFGLVTDPNKVDAGACWSDSTRFLFWQRNPTDIQRLSNVGLIGAHQWLNLAVAAQAAADFGVSPSVIREALSSFRGLPHRLQTLGQCKGKLWIDDSKATNPSAAKAAICVFEKVIWICGGLTKDADLSELKEAVKQHVVYALVIGKDPKPFVTLLEETGVPYQAVKQIEKAVKLAAEHDSTWPVLLSPAAASQDQFRDYAHRGEAFRNAVKALEGFTA